MIGWLVGGPALFFKTVWWRRDSFFQTKQYLTNFSVIFPVLFVCSVECVSVLFLGRPALRVVDVSLLQHTWFKWMACYQASAELDDELMVWILCFGGTWTEEQDFIHFLPLVLVILWHYYSVAWQTNPQVWCPPCISLVMFFFYTFVLCCWGCNIQPCRSAVASSDQYKKWMRVASLQGFGEPSSECRFKQQNVENQSF